ncbi:MAG: hypothetical protein ACR65T_13095 [Methylocystis sp.]|uniref:hypothetical protein n=1 Tax=Methylocystis sp. TaxID=1911079 RepID=UPI003DA54F21
MTNDDDVESLRQLAERAGADFQKAPSVESRAKLDRALTAWEEALEKETLIHESKIPEFILITDPTWRRWRDKEFPKGFPQPKQISGRGNCYSIDELRCWDESRILQIVEDIEPRQLPEPRAHAPDRGAEKMRKMGAATYEPTAEEKREHQRRLMAMNFNERWTAEVRDTIAFMNWEIAQHLSNQVNSKAEKMSAEAMLRIMRHAKMELEGNKISIKLRKDLERAGLNADRFIEICETHTKMPLRASGSDAFEQRIATKYARILLERAGRNDLIVTTKGVTKDGAKPGAWARLAAALYGDPDADLSPYCRELGSGPIKFD